MDTLKIQADKFFQLHHQKTPFIIPNPWDVGTAHLLSQMGFKALATTSAGCAFFAGKKDNTLGREAILANAQVIVAATDLPVSADLENGFGDSADAVAETIQRAIQIGLVGGSIEDADNYADSPIYTIAHAADRIAAAASVIKSSGIPFVLTARAENYLLGRQDIKDTIERLQAYQEAGADVLYAPGITRREDIASIISAIDKPLNVVMGLAGANFTLNDLSDLGVKRVSTGSAMARAALGAFLSAAEEMREQGSFEFAQQAINYGDISAQLKD